MQTTFRLFPPCFVGILLFLASGCGGAVSPTGLSHADQAKIDRFIEMANLPPKLTPVEQREADYYIDRHGRDAISYYLADYFRSEEMRRNAEGNRVLEFLKYFVSQGASVTAQNHRGFTPLGQWVNSMDGISPEDIEDEFNIAKFRECSTQVVEFPLTHI